MVLEHLLYYKFNNMKHEVIDNFLPEEQFKGLYNLITNPNQFSWFYHDSIATDNDKDKSHFYFCHVFYSRGVPNSNLFNELGNIWDALDKNNHSLKSLIRAKANLFTRTPTLVEHDMHKDYAFEHKGGLFSLNTCNGYTLLEDGTKINSVANRMLIFDASKNHASTSCTNENVRININFNFF